MAQQVSTQLEFLRWDMSTKDDMWEALKELVDDHDFNAAINVFPENGNGERTYRLTVNVNTSLGQSVEARIGSVLVLLGGSLEVLTTEEYSAKYGPA